jgi:predicted dehydrogenase
MTASITRRSFVAAAAAAPLRLPGKIRIALAGVEGHMGEILGQLPSLPDVELVAAADRSAAAASKAVARANPNARIYADYREMLDKEKLDLAAIGGANGDRAAAVLACLERRLHVVAEKPLGIVRADVDRIRAAVEKNRVHLTMLLPMRFAPPYLALRRIVESGEIGEVAQMGAQKSYKLGSRPEWMKKHASFGGTIPYIGIHMVDLMRFTSGRELVEAASFQTRLGHPEIADATLRMDYLRPETAPTHGDDRLRLAGTEGVAEFQEATGVTLVTGKSKPRRITDLPPSRSLFADFLDSVYNGKTPALTLTDIWRANEICFAAREAAERHAFVKT